MNSVIFLSIASLVFMSIIGIVYFGKEKIETAEIKIFSYLLVATIIGLVFEIFSAIPVPSEILWLRLLLKKIFMICILVWANLFILYTIFVIKERKEHLSKNGRLVFIIFNTILALILILSPLHLNYGADGIVLNSYGPGQTMLSLITILYSILIFIALLIRIKKIRNRKMTPLILFVFMMMISGFIQFRFPGIILTNLTLSAVVLTMYFTIENPDVKMIEQLNLAKDAAEKANLAKTEFLSSMSHEIRTPLNAIVGFSECMLEAKELTKETKEFAKDIVDASNNLLEIVNGILDISKIEANKMEIIPKEYNPREVFNSLSKLVKPRIGEKPIEFKMVMSSDLPGILKGDVGKVKQIILNILTNAAKYTDKGEIIFNINCINRADTNTCLLYISVKDTGRGIKKENLEKLFNKFERLDEEKNTTTEGTGLGLAITKSLAEMMGGRINVFSKYGEGSTFRIYLEQEIISMEVPKDHSEEIKIDYSLYKGKRILVVDDSKINIKVALQILKPYNLSVATAESGYEALELAETSTFDLILMDIMMPKMNGVETLRRLKEINNFNVPVIALTADAIEASDEKYINAGFNDYLSKPIDRYELNRVLSKYLGGNNNEKN